ncbi:MAG: chemotaxis protein CheW [Gammaproteobacteria bacterium]|nr:chemotaxis protein CheW [Gammaproteobacteria bacterium]
MTDHKFSNQKSALEDYFQSLLSDEVASEIADQENVVVKPVAAVAEVPQAETMIDTTATQAEQKLTLNEAIIAPARPAIQRPSVADMLAKVEKVAEVTSAEIDFAEPVTEIRIPMPSLAQPVETKTEIVAEVEVEVEVKVEEKLDVEVAKTLTVNQEAALETTQTPVVQRNEPPEWAESRFQCLLFQVGGLSLAVPLVTLNGVIPWPENVVETPNQTDWYLGVLMNHGNKVQVIDTAVMVLPEEHRKDMAAEAAERLSHILLVDDQRWGLACESIGDVVWLNKDDVKWRSNTTKRPWLLGTAIEHMCAVMDTSAFADMLTSEK